MNIEQTSVRADLSRARQAPGMLLNFLAMPEETGGAYALIEARAVPGMEPPLHWHEHEDEAFYMIDGRMIVTIGDAEHEITSGDFLSLPRGIPHTQKILSDSVHALLLITPGRLAHYFMNLTMPAADLTIPPPMPGPPPPEMMEKLAQLDKEFGIFYPES